MQSTDPARPRQAWRHSQAADQHQERPIGKRLQVSLHGGSANKNIGDAFLLVWKIPDQARFPGATLLAPSRSNSLTSAINRKLFPRRCAGPCQLSSHGPDTPVRVCGTWWSG